MSEFDEKLKKADAEAAAARLPSIQTMADFVAGYVPADYLIDGIFQKGFLYTMTAPTSAGKTAVSTCITMHVAIGELLHGRDVVQSRVLYFVGENPDDVRPRYIKSMEIFGLDPAKVDIVFVDGTYDLSAEAIRDHIAAEVERVGPVGLVIVDTSSAYFVGKDENDNPQMIAHARMLRSLTKLPGGPAVIALCHPNKNGDSTVPRGGGALLAEVDGNTYLVKDGVVTTLHRHDKFRGAMWEPMAFRLDSGTSDKLRDSQGRAVWTVTATPISDSEKASLDDTADQRRADLLALMKARSKLSMTDMARELEWFRKNHEPNKSLVQRVLDSLKVSKLVEIKDGHAALTSAGRKAAGEWRGPRQTSMELSDEI